MAAARRVAHGDAVRRRANERWLRQAGELSLARCDLVEAFDANAVSVSEMRIGAAEYHFVRV